MKKAFPIRFLARAASAKPLLFVRRIVKGSWKHRDAIIGDGPRVNPSIELGIERIGIEESLLRKRLYNIFYRFLIFCKIDWCNDFGSFCRHSFGQLDNVLLFVSVFFFLDRIDNCTSYISYHPRREITIFLTIQMKQKFKQFFFAINRNNFLFSFFFFEFSPFNSSTHSEFSSIFA